jgi:hydrogenase maturation protease
MPKMSDPDSAGTVVLGLGNPLMGDDGLGLAVLARLVEEWDFSPPVQLVDGGTWGMNLLPLIEDAERLVLLDAIHTGTAPGTVVELEREAIPRYLAHKLSPHQVDLKEVLALAELRGTLTEATVAIGAEPEAIELMYHLSPRLEQRVEDISLAVVNRLAHWGHHCQRRAAVVDA